MNVAELSEGDLIVTKNDRIYKVVEEYPGGRKARKASPLAHRNADTDIGYVSCRRIFPDRSSCVYVLVKSIKSIVRKEKLV